MTRVESPSSINTFKQCKRKYFYNYKIKLPRTENISAITGKAVHEALENFFKIDTTFIVKSNYEIILKQKLLNLFNESWTKAMPSLIKLENDKETIRKHYKDSMSMLQNFLNDFLSALSVKINGSSFEQAFKKLTPKTEVFLSSDKYKVRGYIDAILDIDDDIYILDYKTSSRDHMSEEYELQLAIYALMFHEKNQKFPHKVGIHFLRHGSKKYLDITPQLIAKAKRECDLIQLKTGSDVIEDYDKNPGPLCKWKTGQCSFYDHCFGVKKLNDF